MKDIQIENLTKQYSGRTVLSLPHLSIGGGELVGLVGNNGAGKTTMLRLVLDLIRADSGWVSNGGDRVSETEQWKSWTGSYIDGRFLIDFLTPEEYFDFIAGVYGIERDQLRARLRQFDAFMHDEVLGTGKRLHDFSQGNRQKVGIIGAMIVEPEVLLLDEPFNFLDPSSQMWIARMIADMRRRLGTTVIISSHNLSYVADISSRVLLLEQGCLLHDIDNTNGQALSLLRTYFESQSAEQASE